MRYCNYKHETLLTVGHGIMLYSLSGLIIETFGYVGDASKPDQHHRVHLQDATLLARSLTSPLI